MLCGTIEFWGAGGKRGLSLLPNLGPAPTILPEPCETNIAALASTSTF